MDPNGHHPRRVRDPPGRSGRRRDARRDRPARLRLVTAPGRPTAGSRRRRRSRRRSIRERLRQPTTWCALALSGGEPAGHVGITHARERERAARATSPAWRTSGCCSCARRGGAAGWPRACNGLGRRGGRRAGLRDDPPATRPQGAARARAFYEREGWRTAGARVPRAAARARPRRVPSRSVRSRDVLRSRPAGRRSRSPIAPRRSRRPRERSRVSWRTRVQRLRLSWRSRFQASVSAALAWLIATKVLGHPQPFFAPVVGHHRARHHDQPARARARSSSRSASRSGSPSPTCWRSRSAPARPSLRWSCRSPCRPRIFFGSSQLFVNQVAVSAALVSTVCSRRPTASRSRARSTR